MLRLPDLNDFENHCYNFQIYSLFLTNKKHEYILHCEDFSHNSIILVSGEHILIQICGNFKIMHRKTMKCII